MKNTEIILEVFALDNSMETFLANKKERPTWDFINSSINKAFEFGGSVSLDIHFPQDSYIKSATMTALVGEFRLILLTRDKDVKRDVLEWWEPEDSGRIGLIRYGDDEWDIRTSCRDINVAKDIFMDLNDNASLNDKNIENFRSRWDRKP